MWEILIVSILFILSLWGINWLMGYRKGNITLDLDNRYTNLNEYVNAVQLELEKQGRNVTYQGNRAFLIDGKVYILNDMNVSMGGVPLQHTILRRRF
jgi:hypothetical protein